MAAGRAAWRGLAVAALLLAPCASKQMDCYMPEDNGYSYRGLVNFAMSGRTCLKWTDQSEISITAQNGIGHHSYCRNPDESGGTPWCFVHGAGLNEVRREPCQVEVCDDELRDFQAEADALETYMGSHNCNCGASLLELGHSLRSRSTLRGAAALAPDAAASSPAANASAALPVSASQLQGFLAACRKEAKLPESSGNATADAAARRRSRRQCGLTEVLTKHCRCSPRAAVADAPSGPVVLAAGQAADEAAGSGHWHPSCSNACYSTSCSSCMSCTAVCMFGPFPYCKINATASEQKWYGRCGYTKHEELMAGYKQCGDAAPTGCPS